MKHNKAFRWIGGAVAIFLLAHCNNRTEEEKAAAPEAVVGEGSDAQQTESMETRPESSGLDSSLLSTVPVMANAAVPVYYHKPRCEPTGKVPEMWEGRSAEEEETRLRDTDEWSAAKLEFFNQWGEVDPRSALDAARVTDRDSITAATVAALRGWASQDASAARSWVDSQPENAERTLYVRALLEIGDFEPDDLSAWQDRGSWLAAQVDLPGVHPLLVDHLTGWSALDREEALGWFADSITEPAQRQLVADQWMRRDLAADESLATTTGWLEKYESGPLKDALLLSFVKEAARSDATGARQWAELIGDSEIREVALDICEPD